MKKKLLVVDPDRRAQDFLREKLEAPNVEVTTLTTGEEALERLEREAFDLLLARLEMPPPSGLDLLAHIMGGDRSIPVILSSPFFLDEEPTRKCFQNLGGFFAIGRPIVINNLYETIECALEFMIEGRERRRYPRLPVQLDLTFAFESEQAASPEQTLTLDISLGGLSFELPLCDVCAGYERGTVHPKCRFSDFHYVRDEARVIELDLVLSPDRVLAQRRPELETQVLRLKGKVAHIIQPEGRKTEVVGMKFVDISPRDRNCLKEFLRLSSEEQKDLLREQSTRRPR